MWIPKTEAAIQQALEAGPLSETPTFDAKGKPGIPMDIAKDITAMATDGGVLLFGVGQDELKRVTKLTPFPLAGADERIDQIARSNISETPEYHIRKIESAADPAVGYLVVVVPLSMRAPHQLTAGQDLRFWGRGATGNRPLTEGEVARLYERRRRWDRDANALLDAEIARAPFERREKFAYLHLFCQPVVQDDGLLERAVTIANTLPIAFLSQLSFDVLNPTVFSPTFSPDFIQNPCMNSVLNGWGIYFHARPLDESRGDPDQVLDLFIDYDGGGHLFCGGVGKEASRYIIVERAIAGLLTRFLAYMGGMYSAADYFGAVDIGVAVTGINGAYSSSREQTLTGVPLDHDVYRQTARKLAPTLAEDPRGIARELLVRLITATTQGNTFDPFDPTERW